MILALIGAAILYLTVSPFAAVLLGRAIKLRDARELPAGGCGDHVDPARRGAA